MDTGLIAIVCFFVVLNIYLTMKNSIPLLGLIVGSLSVTIGAGIVGNSVDYVFQPYLSLLLIFCGIVCLYSAGLDMKSRRRSR